MLLAAVSGCTTNQRSADEAVLKAIVVTEPVRYDSDDPALWLHPTDRSKSLILGTDKDEDGAIFVFDVNGKILHEKTVSGLKRPNNVDVEYGLSLAGGLVDIAVTTERLTNKLRVYRLPDMKPIDNGGIEVFEGQAQRDPMGISLYKRPKDGVVYAVVSRKEGPTSGGYLWQYRLEDDGKGNVRGIKVREFGLWSGKKEIEAIAVDDELGYVYYSDEQFGVRKYYADPDRPEGNLELARFATTGFAGDHEGISIYTINDGTGYILVSDQQANKFQIFTREGEQGNPHSHKLVKIVTVSAVDSDGSEITSAVIDSRFPSGLFVVMSTDRTYHYYSWDDIAGKDLVRAPNGVR
ncbi:MAG: phytase [Ignavibacteria bacterium]|nr:phytase [Ignavibacteria bacterium]